MKKNGTARLSLAGAMVAAMCVAYVHAQFGNAPAKLNTVKIADDLYVIHNDFVPGNKVMFYTDFSEDRVGNFALSREGGETFDRKGTFEIRYTLYRRGRLPYRGETPP